MRRYLLLAPIASVLLAASCGSSSSSSSAGSDGAAGATSSSSTGTGAVFATNCTTSFPSDAGPAAVCDISFTCDQGAFNLSCTLNGSITKCQCSTGQTFETNSFKCDTDGAVVAANIGCGWDLSLAQ